MPLIWLMIMLWYWWQIGSFTALLGSLKPCSIIGYVVTSGNMWELIVLHCYISLWHKILVRKVILIVQSVKPLRHCTCMAFTYVEVHEQHEWTLLLYQFTLGDELKIRQHKSSFYLVTVCFIKGNSTVMWHLIIIMVVAFWERQLHSCLWLLTS